MSVSDVDIPDVPREPSLEELLALHAKATLDGVRTSLPCRIVDYDETKQSASIQPLIQHGFIDATGVRQVETLPIVHDVPVKFGGGGGARRTYPVAVGDIGMAWFTSSSIARWVLTGKIVDPGDDRRHDLNDAVIEVGLHSFNTVPTDAPTDAVVDHIPDGMTLKIGSSGASQKIVGDSALTYFMTALAAAITAQSANPPGAAALAALQTALTSGPGWQAGTTKGLIE